MRTRISPERGALASRPTWPAAGRAPANCSPCSSRRHRYAAVRTGHPPRWSTCGYAVSSVPSPARPRHPAAEPARGRSTRKGSAIKANSSANTAGATGDATASWSSGSASPCGRRGGRVPGKELLHGLAAVSGQVAMSVVTEHVKEAIAAMVLRLFLGAAGGGSADVEVMPVGESGASLVLPRVRPSPVGTDPSDHRCRGSRGVGHPELRKGIDHE